MLAYSTDIQRSGCEESMLKVPGPYFSTQGISPRRNVVFTTLEFVLKMAAGLVQGQ